MLGFMDAEPFDSAALEAHWVTNERELNRIRIMPRPVREVQATKAERLEAEQDAIESRLGFDSPTNASSNCASYLSHGAPNLPAITGGDRGSEAPDQG